MTVSSYSRYGRQDGRKSDLEFLRSLHPIEQVVSAYVPVKKMGRVLRARCPFPDHKDGDPSFVLYPHNQSYYCFGCGRGGDVFTFLEQVEGIDFKEAVQRLEGDAFGGYRPSEFAVDESEPELTERQKDMLTAAAELYHTTLWAEQLPLRYLRRRGLDEDTLRKFRVGFARGNDLRRFLEGAGFTGEEMAELELAGPHGEFFRQRIIFPERRDGKVVFLTGRKGAAYQRAKYLGLANAPKPLYGLETARGASEVCLVEGPFDFFALHKWEFPAVALLGAHLKPELVAELEFASRIYVVTDSDPAGRTAARELAETLGERASIIPPLPGAKDVSELACQPDAAQTFRGLVEQAVPASRYLARE